MGCVSQNPNPKASSNSQIIKSVEPIKQNVPPNNPVIKPVHQQTNQLINPKLNSKILQKFDGIPNHRRPSDIPAQSISAPSGIPLSDKKQQIVSGFPQPTSGLVGDMTNSSAQIVSGISNIKNGPSQIIHKTQDQDFVPNQDVSKIQSLQVNFPILIN